MAKRKNGIVLNISGVITIIVIIVSIIYGFAKQRYDTDDVKKEVVSVGIEVEGIDKRVDIVEDAIIGAQYELKYIRKDMFEQKELSKEILKEIKK